MRFALALIVALLSVRHAGAQVPTAADIDRLIAIGKANRLKDLSYQCTAKRASLNMFGGGLLPLAVGASMNKGKTSYDVQIVSNRGLIARAAWDATREQKPFTQADVQPEWLADSLYAVVSPQLPNPKSAAVPILPDPVSDVVFRTSGKKTVLLKAGSPRAAARVWRNADGATVDYVDQTFAIDHMALTKADLYRTNEDDWRSAGTGTDFVLVTANGDRSCVGIPLKKIRNLMVTR